MDDDQILNRGGSEEDIEKYASKNGADLTKEDFKDSWSRKEIIEILYKYEQDTLHYGRDPYYKDIDKVNEWAEDNL